MNPKANSHLDPSARAVIDELGAPGEPSLYLQLIEIYLKTSKDYSAKLADELARNDHLALKRTAHAWKSASLQIGAMALGEHCRSIELASADPQVTVAAALAEYAAVRAELEDQLRLKAP